MVKFSDKGSGWFGQPGRHHNAKVDGYAGGTYAERARHGGNKRLKKLTYKQLRAKGVTLPARKDADGDKVKNARDCRPFDPKKQDSEVIIKHDGKEIGRAKNEAEAFHFIHGQVGYSVQHAMDHEGWTIEEAKTKPGKSEDIFKKPLWTEAEVNLIKNRLNSGKLKSYELPEEGVKLTPEQEKKGYDWLMNQWKTPSGKERTNNPFGYREQEILKNFREFRLAEYYDAGNMYHKFYVPYYRVISTDGDSFEYAVYGGQIHIMG